MSKRLITIRDALLIFWRTVVAVASQAQTTIIGEFNAQNFDGDAIQSWLKQIFDAREGGTLTPQQCLWLQHEQLILEQLGVTSESTVERCTLATLSKMVFNYDGIYHKPDDQCSENRFDADMLKKLAYCYFLLSASHNADLYLNVAFGLILDGGTHGKDAGFCYNSDSKNICELVDVKIVRGSVENSTYCDSTCALSKQEQHTKDCQSRGASWLLLTFSNSAGQKRQVHLDVATSAYRVPTFFDKSHPLACAVGFIPNVDDAIRAQFEKSGWPIGRLPQVEAPKTVPSYRISQFDCVLSVRAHYASINNIAKNFSELTGNDRHIVLLWHNFRHAFQTQRHEQAAFYYALLVQLTTVEHANFLAARFMHYVDANTEAVALKVFVDNLRNYDLVLQQLSGR